MDVQPIECGAAPARGRVDCSGEHITANRVFDKLGIEGCARGQGGHGEAHAADAALEVVAAVARVHHQGPAEICAESKLAGLFAEGAEAAQALTRDSEGDTLGFGVKGAGGLAFRVGRYQLARRGGLSIVEQVRPRRPEHFDEDGAWVAARRRRMIILWERVRHISSTISCRAQIVSHFPYYPASRDTMDAGAYLSTPVLVAMRVAMRADRRRCPAGHSLGRIGVRAYQRTGALFYRARACEAAACDCASSIRAGGARSALEMAGAGDGADCRGAGRDARSFDQSLAAPQRRRQRILQLCHRVLDVASILSQSPGRVSAAGHRAVYAHAAAAGAGLSDDVRALDGGAGHPRLFRLPPLFDARARTVLCLLSGARRGGDPAGALRYSAGAGDTGGAVGGEPQAVRGGVRAASGGHPSQAVSRVPGAYRRHRALAHSAHTHGCRGASTAAGESA